METVKELKYQKIRYASSIENNTQDMLISEAEDLGFMNNNSIYYLKNLFIKYYNPILYICNQENFVKMELDKGNIDIKLYDRSDIKEIQCSIDKKRNYKLSFIVDNNTECFDSENDTSEEYKGIYNEIIKDIITYIGKNK